MSDPNALVRRCAGLLRTPPGPDRERHAYQLGVHAADASHGIRELVCAFLSAASDHWADTAIQSAAPGHSPDTPPTPTGHRPDTPPEPAAPGRPVPERTGGERTGGERTAPDLAVSDRAAGTRPAPDPSRTHTMAAELLTTVRQLTEAALSGYHDRTRNEVSRHDTQRSEFINDLLTGRADPGHLAERAHRYGIRLAGTHVVTIAAGHDLTATLARDVDAALAARYGAGNTLTTLRERQLVCISTGGLRGLPAELAHHLLARLGTGTWQIGVGRPHPGLTGLATSLDEARNTLDLATRLGFTTPVLHAADLLVFPVLLRDREAITDLVTSVLGPLTEARGGAQPYLDTLNALFDNQGNHTATARQLHLSVRAVTYRLDRIHTLTGYHPGEPTQRFTLHTAVLGARLLGWPGTGPEPA